MSSVPRQPQDGVYLPVPPMIIYLHKANAPLISSLCPPKHHQDVRASALTNRNSVCTSIPRFSILSLPRYTCSQKILLQSPVILRVCHRSLEKRDKECNPLPCTRLLVKDSALILYIFCFFIILNGFSFVVFKQSSLLIPGLPCLCNKLLCSFI